jgi:hypothetical protein
MDGRGVCWGSGFGVGGLGLGVTGQLRTRVDDAVQDVVGHCLRNTAACVEGSSTYNRVAGSSVAFAPGVKLAAHRRSRAHSLVVSLHVVDAEWDLLLAAGIDGGCARNAIEFAVSA